MQRCHCKGRAKKKKKRLCTDKSIIKTAIFNSHLNINLSCSYQQCRWVANPSEQNMYTRKKFYIVVPHENGMIVCINHPNTPCHNQLFYLPAILHNKTTTRPPTMGVKCFLGCTLTQQATLCTSWRRGWPGWVWQEKGWDEGLADTGCTRAVLPVGRGWPRFSSCLCSCWRKRGGTSRGG